jgi:hypothetical protein
MQRVIEPHGWGLGAVGQAAAAIEVFVIGRAAESHSWADAGICLKIVGSESSLNFRNIRGESDVVCFLRSLVNDPRIVSLVEVSKMAVFRRLIGELPGYDSSPMGGIERIG